MCQNRLLAVALLLVHSAATAGADSLATNPIVLIDSLMRASWQESEITPAKSATEGEWCRRVFVDLIGRVPRTDELREFLADRSKDRRKQLVQRLLNDSDYADEFARNWTDYWTVALIGRSEGRRNDLMSREGMRQYLDNAIRDNRGYDRIVHDLITARGVSKPGHPQFNGAVNFLMVKLQDKAVAATTKTSQVFLGTRIQCTQCHDHPFNSSTTDQDWSQAQFWGFNSFFRQAVALRRFEPGSRDIDHGELDDQDFGGEGSTPEDAEVYFSQRNGLLKAAYPTFLDGTELKSTSGYLSDTIRREELAKLMVNSHLLERALVNRMWAYFFAYGFTTPVDDFGPHNPPSHPELLEALAAQFREAGFDLRKLMRWIVLSKPYSLSSRAGKAPHDDDPTLGQPPLFSRFYMRQMRPEALYQSMLVVGESNIPPPPRARWLRQFIIASGNDEGTETSTFDGTIPQTLMMFNGPLIQRAISTDDGSFLATLAKKELDARKIIESMYATALSRRPTGAELKLAYQLMSAVDRDAGDNYRLAGLQDVWWALLNSAEFILIH